MFPSRLNQHQGRRYSEVSSAHSPFTAVSMGGESGFTGFTAWQRCDICPFAWQSEQGGGREARVVAGRHGALARLSELHARILLITLPWLSQAPRQSGSSDLQRRDPRDSGRAGDRPCQPRDDPERDARVYSRCGWKEKTKTFSLCFKNRNQKNCLPMRLRLTQQKTNSKKQCRTL